MRTLLLMASVPTLTTDSPLFFGSFLFSSSRGFLQSDQYAVWYIDRVLHGRILSSDECRIQIRVSLGWRTDSKETPEVFRPALYKLSYGLDTTTVRKWSHFSIENRYASLFVSMYNQRSVWFSPVFFAAYLIIFDLSCFSTVSIPVFGNRSPPANFSPNLTVLEIYQTHS